MMITPITETKVFWENWGKNYPKKVKTFKDSFWNRDRKKIEILCIKENPVVGLQVRNTLYTLPWVNIFVHLYRKWWESQVNKTKGFVHLGLNRCYNQRNYQKTTNQEKWVELSLTKP